MTRAVGATNATGRSYDLRLAKRRILIAGGVIIGLLLAMMALIFFYMG